MATSVSQKSDLKQQIRTLKADIAAAIAAKEPGKLKKLRRQVRRLKAQTRKLAAAKAAPATSVAEPPAPPPAA
ncbi:MAG: hypothetical protein ACREQQ_02270 [Candidatus Binatia bacterium]